MGRRESVKRAQDKYRGRDSEEGREAHRLEEANRREARRSLENLESVGDHRCRENPGGLEEAAMATKCIASEAVDARAEPAFPASFEGVQEGKLAEPAMAAKCVAAEAPGVCAEPAIAVSPEGAQEAKPVEWVLVAWPELLAAARRRLGAEASCPFCGRRGRIARVVCIEEWRRRQRQSGGWT